MPLPIVDGDQEGFEVLIVFCVKRPSEEGALLGWGIRIM